MRNDGDFYRKRMLKGFKGNPKRFYGYMRGLQSVKDNVMSLSKEDGTLTENNKEAADELAKSIQSMFTKEVLAKHVHPQTTLSTEQFWKDEDMSFSADDVAAKLKGLATDKSAGPDGMHPMLLKSCAQAIAWPLCLIFSASWEKFLLTGRLQA